MYGVDTVANHLSHPWAIAFLPDGKMLVTERAGKVLIFQDGIRLDHEIDFPALFVRGQGGLMDIELHPDHKNNGWVYFTYEKKINDGGGTAVARSRIDKNALADFQELFVAEPASESGVHFGSHPPLILKITITGY